jgi:hypothetical protein
MTTLFDHAIDAVRSLSPDAQDALARLLLQLAGEEQPEVLLPAAVLESLEESMAQASRGERAGDDEVRAVWAKHGL